MVSQHLLYHNKHQCRPQGGTLSWREEFNIAEQSQKAVTAYFSVTAFCRRAEYQQVAVFKRYLDIRS